MSIYDYESAFGAADRTTRAMRSAIAKWLKLYYSADADTQTDPCQRIAYTVVDKLSRGIFGEYRASIDSKQMESTFSALNEKSGEAVQLALIGGECYLKPYPTENGFGITLIPRNNVLIFARNADGEPTDIGTVEKSTYGKYFYTLLERRSVDAQGYLTIENTLYRSMDGHGLGSEVSLTEHPEYAALSPHTRFETPLGGIGLVRMATPMRNCVDGSPDGVSVYAAAAGLIANIDRNEALLNGEFERGQSRIIASADLLRTDGDGSRKLYDTLFVGLDEDPERVGVTVFSPTLREKSYLARKHEYLRNVESVIGLKRGMLSDANEQSRTATEITASTVAFNLTIEGFQQMWERALRKTLALCVRLARMYGVTLEKEPEVCIDWGNGVLHDEESRWQGDLQMVQAGILKPEIALGRRFYLPADTPEQLSYIRKKLMPE